MAIVKATPGTAARRVLRFLDDHGLFERDLTAKDTARAALERSLNELPTTMRAEIRRWVSALRGEGRRRHHVMPFRTIDLYLWNVQPILERWADRGSSLREIDTEDVAYAIDQYRGHRAQSVRTALRS